MALFHMEKWNHVVMYVCTNTHTNTHIHVYTCIHAHTENPKDGAPVNFQVFNKTAVNIFVLMKCYFIL